MSTDGLLLVVGASHAGVQLASNARDNGFSGRIVLVGEEAEMPYQRPPLSKGLLTGKTTIAKLALRGESYFPDNGIELESGRRVVRIDRDARRVAFADGAAIRYDWLALTVGARCRTITAPGSDLSGIVHLRHLRDAQRIAQVAERARHACVVGGGFIGLEVAASLSSLGVSVTVIEAQERLLARAFTPTMSDFVADLHRARGVRIELSRGVAAFRGSGGNVEAVELIDGARIDCELVVVGIGVIPNAEIAGQAGIATADGILVDTLGRTSAARVLAAGDCAAMPSPFSPTPDRPLRLESIQAANDGARAAASVLVGRAQPSVGVPWFWSDQYDAKFQMAGLGSVADDTVVRGRPDDGRFSVYCLRAGRLVAAHSVNRPAEHMLARRLIAAGARPSVMQLADASFDLRTLLPDETGAPAATDGAR